MQYLKQVYISLCSIARGMVQSEDHSSASTSYRDKHFAYTLTQDTRNSCDLESGQLG